MRVHLNLNYNNQSNPLSLGREMNLSQHIINKGTELTERVAGPIVNLDLELFPRVDIVY